MTVTELALAAGDPPEPFTGRLRLAVAAYLARLRAPPASTPNPTCAATWPGAPDARRWAMLEIRATRNRSGSGPGRSRAFLP
jgi:hypothetical protein